MIILKKAFKLFLASATLFILGRVYNVQQKAPEEKEPISRKNKNILDYKSFIQEIADDLEVVRDAFGGCFAPDVLVAVAKNGENLVKTKRIEEIHEGDMIMSLDCRKGALVQNMVSRVTIHAMHPYQMMEITTESGAFVVSTDNHPIIVHEKNIGIPARDLEVGQKILVYADREAKWDRVTGLRSFVVTTPVYGVEVESDPHNFFVSSLGNSFILAHNTCCK